MNDEQRKALESYEQRPAGGAVLIGYLLAAISGCIIGLIAAKLLFC